MTDDDILADSSSTSRITACALYADTSGWLSKQLLPNSSSSCKALVCRANGAMEIFAVPEMVRVWAVDDMADLPTAITARDDVSSAISGELSTYADDAYGCLRAVDNTVVTATSHVDAEPGCIH